MPMRRGHFAGALLAALIGAAPAASADPKIQPAQQLGLVGPHIPDVLKQAQADPYAPPAAPACVTLPRELAELDALLGPDINQPREKTFEPTAWIGHALRGAIPYRGYIRFLTGADRKEKQLNHATMAGWARRGFLKGLAAKLDCPSRTQTAAAAPEADLSPAEPAARAPEPAPSLFPVATRPVLARPRPILDGDMLMVRAGPPSGLLEPR